MSKYPKIITKMTSYLHNMIFYLETVIHPAGGQPDGQKTKRRSGKKNSLKHTSPDSHNIRATLKAQNNVRKNPAP